MNHAENDRYWEQRVEAGQEEKGPEMGDLRACRRCSEPLSDTTRHFCVFCVLAWLMARPIMRKRIQ